MILNFVLPFICSVIVIKSTKITTESNTAVLNQTNDDDWVRKLIESTAKTKTTNEDEMNLENIDTTSKNKATNEDDWVLKLFKSTANNKTTNDDRLIWNHNDDDDDDDDDDENDDKHAEEELQDRDSRISENMSKEELDEYCNSKNVLIMPDFRAPGKRIAEQKCEEYLWTVKEGKKEDVRKDFCSSRKLAIAGGIPAKDGEFPHMGAIGWRAVKEWFYEYVFKCGCILISPNYVMTAAHCTRDSGSDRNVADVVPKIIGFGDLYSRIAWCDHAPKTESGCSFQHYGGESYFPLHLYRAARNISKIIVHPDYTSPIKYNDIALMELDKPVDFGFFVQPSCLWHSFDTTPLGARAITTGWGALDAHSRKISPILRKVKLDIIDSKTCDELLQPHCSRHWCGINDTQICAGKLSGKRDACHGDSGGPLEVKIPQKSGPAKHYVIGVVSFGFGCGLKNTPGVYTRVSSYVDWIESHVWKYLYSHVTAYEKFKSVFNYKTNTRSGMTVTESMMERAHPEDACYGTGIITHRRNTASYLAPDSNDEKWIWGTTEPSTTKENISSKFNHPSLPQEDSCMRKNSTMPDYSAPGKRIAEQKCEEYLWTIKTKLEENYYYDHCSPQIIGGGGRDAKLGEFPHMGAIGWRTVEKTWIYKCGSILISPNFVLTAAHCSRASEKDTQIAEVVPKIIRFGDRYIVESYDKIIPVIINISRIIIHPDYKSPNKYDDIALMELDEHLEFEQNIQPACLWHQFDTKPLGDKATATGWGVIEAYSREASPILQVVELDVIDSKTCDDLLRPKCNRLWCGIQDTQICAGKLEGGVDTCQGDSGGPLQVKIPLNWRVGGAMHYVIGVVSFGFGCLQKNTPGVYTRISPYVEWIESHVWK